MNVNSDTGSFKAALEYAKAEALPGLAVQFLKRMLADVNTYQKAEVDLTNEHLVRDNIITPPTTP